MRLWFLTLGLAVYAMLVVADGFFVLCSHNSSSNSHVATRVIQCCSNSMKTHGGGQRGCDSQKDCSGCKDTSLISEKSSTAAKVDVCIPDIIFQVPYICAPETSEVVLKFDVLAELHRDRCKASTVMRC